MQSQMPQELHCPFCEQTTSKPQGLAGHIRYRHPKQYPKWLKNPSRLTDAMKSVSPKISAPEPKEAVVVAELSRDEKTSVSPASDGIPALDLINQVHAQLIGRKQKIEAELAGLTDLRKELEAIDIQIKALNDTLAVFKPSAAS